MDYLSTWIVTFTYLGPSPLAEHRPSTSFLQHTWFWALLPSSVQFNPIHWISLSKSLLTFQFVTLTVSLGVSSTFSLTASICLSLSHIINICVDTLTSHRLGLAGLSFSRWLCNIYFLQCRVVSHRPTFQGRKCEGSLFVWPLLFDLFSMGGPTRSSRLQLTHL